MQGVRNRKKKKRQKMLDVLGGSWEFRFTEGESRKIPISRNNLSNKVYESHLQAYDDLRVNESGKTSQASEPIRGFKSQLSPVQTS